MEKMWPCRDARYLLICWGTLSLESIKDKVLLEDLLPELVEIMKTEFGAKAKS